MAPLSLTKESSGDDLAEAEAMPRSLGAEQAPKIQPWLKLKECKGVGREGGEGQPAVAKDEHGFAPGEMFLIGHGGRPFKSCWTRVEGMNQ